MKLGIGPRKSSSVCSLMVFGGSEISIYSISVDRPRIHAIVLKDGEANWNITKSDTAALKTGAKAFKLHLNSYEITNGYISYTDAPRDMDLEIGDLNHSGSGDFNADLFTLHTKTSAGSVSCTYTKIPYLRDASASLSADIEVDNTKNQYTFKTDDVHLNDLKLGTEGFFRFVNDSTYGMDIKFQTTSTDFKTFLSLIPSIYKNDFDKIKTSGNAAFGGYVKGEYNASRMPSYLVNLSVDNGFFQYPDLPEPVKNISVLMKVSNPDGVTDHTVIDISKAHIEFGKDPFDFRILLQNPMTARYIDATVKGKLNLADVTRFVKLSNGTKLAGLLDVDANAKGNLSAITTQQARAFSANGFLHLSGLNYSSPDFIQGLKNGNIQIVVNNPDGLADHTTINVPSGHIEVGSDAMDFNISVKNPVSNPAFNGRIKGGFNLDNVKEFTTLPSTTHVSGLIAADISFDGNKEAVTKKEYEKINFSGNVSLKNVQYSSKEYPDAFNLSNAEFSATPKSIVLHNAQAAYLTSNYTASGSLDNVIAYMLNDEPVSGNLDVYADQIDLNKIFASQPSDTSRQTKSSAPFEVSKKFRFLIHTKVDKMHYDKVDYTNLSGSLAINDETIALKDVAMNALDGKLIASGFYSTKKSKSEPEFSLNYDMTGLDIQKTFLAFNTVQKIMPAAQFINGQMSSKSSLNGRMRSDMSPDLNSLTGKGTLNIINGALKNFAPVEKIAQMLHIDQLNNLALKDVNFSFEFANGKVLVKPFHVKAAGLDMEIGGMHGFDQSIDYVIAMKVPRAMMGSGANNLINNLVQQANNKGVPVKVSDDINLTINMVGTLTNPQLKSGLSATGSDMAGDLKQQAAQFAKQGTDSVKTIVQQKTNEVKDSATAIKNQAVKDLQKDLGKMISQEKDSTGNSSAVLENTQKHAQETLKNTFDNLFGKKKAKDTTRVK